MPLLSVILPVYNEVNTVRGILEKVSSVNIDKEIIVVDDGSFDGTERTLKDIRLDNMKIIHHSRNRGKGAAFLTGLNNASGEFVIIQDADLEYNPDEYLKLMAEMKKGDADIILGARFMEGYYGSFVPRFGNRLLTNLLNFFFGIKLNDCFTCYKMFRRDTINKLNLKEQNFTIETEIIAKALKRGLSIREVPISYRPRSYSEGKKIRVKDGIRAIISIFKYRFSA